MAVTPNYSWPVPVNTDLVKDGAEAIKDLGDAIDATVFGLPSGGISLISSTTVTAQASFSISSVFSATYDNYVIAINLVQSTSAQNELRYRLRTSGGDDSSVVYDFGLSLIFYNATTSIIGGAYAATSALINTNFYPANPIKFNLNLNGINTASKSTTAVINGGNSSGSGQGTSGCSVNSAATHTGITFFSSAGTTYTGKIKIYGLAN